MNNNILKEQTRGMRRAAAVLICICILAGMLGGCAQAPQPATEKIVVTTLYIKDFPQFEQMVESTYPDIDLQCEIMPYTTEQLRRLEKESGPDLVIYPQPASADVERYLLDISDTAASSAYDGTIMKQSRINGKTYLLPLPGQYYGYIVNVTLFEQAGLSLPTTNEELAEDLYELKERGIGVGEDGTNFAIQCDYFSDLGMYYVGYMVPDLLGTLEGARWLSDYRNKEATMAGAWDNVFSLTDMLVGDGLLDPAAISRQRNSIKYSPRMSRGALAAVFGDSSLFSLCVAKNKEAVAAGTAPEYEYRMLPLLSNEGNEPWILFAPSAYVGINAAVSEEKQEACRRVLELSSTQEGQDAVIADLQMGASCLRDYQPDSTFVPEGVEEYVESGYVYNVNFPDKMVEYLGSTAQKLMAGKFTQAEALEALDQYYYEGSDAVDYNLSVVGEVGQDMILQDFNVRKEETELGNFLSDCVAEISGAPIAVVNGGSIRSSLYTGEIYGEDLEALFPFENMIVVLEMDGQTVWNMLENAVSTVGAEWPGGRFLQISGLHYTFDSGKPVGSQLVSVTLPDGTALDFKGRYQVAVTNYMAGFAGYAEGNGDEYTMLNWYDDDTPKGSVDLVAETGLTYRDALKIYFENHEGNAVGARLEGRITNLDQK